MSAPIDLRPDAAAAPASVVLEARGIRKRFPGVMALDDVSFTLHRGEIHALLGENGAGKSTLIKVLTGALQPDGGELVLDGEPLSLGSPRDARTRGLSLVPQDVLVVPRLSIGRNVLLGVEGGRTRKDGLTVDERAEVQRAFDRLGAAFAPDTPASALGVPELRLAQVARTLVRPGRVLLLDEPTAVLSEADAAHLLERLVAFRDEGRAIIYVTHRLSEVMQVADRVTVLRDGRNVGTFPRAQVDKERLIDLMAKPGASPPAPAPAPARARRAAVHGPPVLEVRGLTRAGAFADVGLTVAPGQIIGIAGVQGSGHGPLLHAIAGALRADAGSVAIAGEAVAAGSLAQAYRRGALLVPADRRRAAMVAPQSVRANIVLSRRVRASCRRLGLRWPRRERQVAREYVEAFAVKARGTETAAGTLSGGNQQKVALARALESDPRVLLVEEPTQGIDVNAKREIRRLLERLAHEDGRAVVIATSEFEELLGLADVVHVMRLGRLAATLPGPDASYREILSHALP